MSTAAVRARGLVKRFDQVTAVAGIDLEISRGECVGLLGPNGAGKTTTLEILEGLQHPTSGEVEILGRRWAERPEEIRSRIGVQLQQTNFYDRLTVLEMIRLYRSFYPTGLTEETALAQARLEEKRDTRVMHLSGGQKQRLALAVALVGDPELIFLDEPTTGLDPQSRHALWDIVLELKRRGRTLVLTTHYMEEAERLCDRLIVVDGGKVIASGTPSELIGRLPGAHVVELATQPPLPPEAFALAGVKETHPHGDGHRLVVSDLHRVLPALLGAVHGKGVSLLRLTTRSATLDDVFLALTGRNLREET